MLCKNIPIHLHIRGKPPLQVAVWFVSPAWLIVVKHRGCLGLPSVTGGGLNPAVRLHAWAMTIDNLLSMNIITNYKLLENKM